MAKKPERVITRIRTGTGDSGTTTICGQVVSKSSLLIRYLGMLDLCQSLTYDPMIQDQLFTMGALVNNPEHLHYLSDLNNYTAWQMLQIDRISKSLPPLKGFLRTTKQNRSLMRLRATVRQAESLAAELHSMFSNSPIDDNAVIVEFFNYGPQVMALNVLSDYIFALAWQKQFDHNASNNHYDLLYVDVWTGKNEVPIITTGESNAN